VRRRTYIIILIVLLIAGAAGAGVWWSRRPVLPNVTTETLYRRDLEAIVSASGKIQPKRQVNMSATVMGRVTRLSVEEGQRVRAGQFLLEIDPRALAGQLQRGEAGVAAARSALEQVRSSVEEARANLDLARQNLRRQQDLWSRGLTPRETLERAQNEVAVRDSEFKARQQEVETREQQIRQEQANLATTRYNLSQVVISSPMDGIVTRRNIEEGENVVVGTMNNPGTVLLTIADMSVIEAEIEVDETDIPSVLLGQSATITIDAVADRMFRGRVTEIGNSPIQQTGPNTQNTGQRQATNFKVVVTIEDKVPDVRPGFTCTAEIVTATRKNVVSVPIQALAVRELLYDATGALIRQPPPPRRRRLLVAGNPDPAAPPAVELKPGQTRKETEGVFVVRDQRAVFTPVKVGIAGERYFEVMSGLAEGNRVITGPFSSVRELADGELVNTGAPER
jgi:HlyD family secretion protein